MAHARRERPCRRTSGAGDLRPPAVPPAEGRASGLGGPERRSRVVRPPERGAAGPGAWTGPVGRFRSEVIAVSKFMWFLLAVVTVGVAVVLIRNRRERDESTFEEFPAAA